MHGDHDHRFAHGHRLGRVHVRAPSRRSAARSSSTRPWPTRSSWFDLHGQVSEIDVKADAGVSPDTLAGRVRAVLPPYAEVKTGAQAAADQTKQVSDAIGGFLKPVLLSVRRHRRARRRVHHLQRVLDDRRPAAARVRDAARARGVAPPGARLRHRRGALPWACSPRVLGHPRRARRRRRRRSGCSQAANIDIPHSGLVLAPRTIVVALAVGVVVTLLSAVDPGGAGDPRAAHGGAAGGRGAAAVALRALHAVRRRRSSPSWERSAIAGRHVRARRHDVSGWAPSRSARCSCSSPWRWSAATSSVRSPACWAGRCRRFPGQRPARARQQPPQPGPHRRDGVGAHDRPRRGRVRGRVRPGAQELVHGQLRPHGAAPTTSCRARTSCPSRPTPPARCRR